MVQLFLPYTITGVKGLLKESAQPPCRRNVTFRQTSLLFALPLHSKCLEECLPAHSGTSTSICWMKERGGSEINDFTIIYSQYPSCWPWDTECWRVKLTMEKRQPANPLELEDKGKTWSKWGVVFSLCSWVQNGFVSDYNMSVVLGISQQPPNIKDHTGWWRLFS